MLERIAIVLGVVIELVRIGEEVIARAERITAAYVRTGQPHPLRLIQRQHVLRTAVQRLADLIADIGVRVLIGDDLYGILHARRAMVGRQH